MWPFKKHNCQVDGHVWLTEHRRGFIYPSSSYRATVDEVEQERKRCKHCPEVEEWKTTNLEYIHGLTMGKEEWQKLRKEGFLRT